MWLACDCHLTGVCLDVIVTWQVCACMSLSLDRCVLACDCHLTGVCLHVTVTWQVCAWTWLSLDRCVLACDCHLTGVCLHVTVTWQVCVCMWLSLDRCVLACDCHLTGVCLLACSSALPYMCTFSFHLLLHWVSYWKLFEVEISQTSPLSSFLTSLIFSRIITTKPSCTIFLTYLNQSQFLWQLLDFRADLWVCESVCTVCALTWYIGMSCTFLYIKLCVCGIKGNCWKCYLVRAPFL